MEVLILFCLSILIFFLLYFAYKNLDRKVWKSKTSEIELYFDDNWKLIKPYMDKREKILVGIIDRNDHSSLMIKVVKDYPDAGLSDEAYFEATRMQMLSINIKNKFLRENIIEFKGVIFKRLVFMMNTNYGELIQHVYLNRNGDKLTGIQFSFPKNSVDEKLENIPAKLEKVLNNLVLNTHRTVIDNKILPS